MIKLIALLFVFACSAVALAQSELDGLLTQARTMRAEQKFDESDEVLKKAFKLIETLPEEDRSRAVGEVRNVAGLNALDRKEYSKAIGQFKKSIEAYQKDGRSNERLSVVAHNLFIATKAANLTEESLAAGQIWLSILEASENTPHTVLADAIDEIAAVQLKAGKLDEGISSVERMATIYRDKEGKNSVALAKTLLTLGFIFQQNKLYERADDCFAKSLEIHLNLHGQVPHEDVINGIYNHAMIQQLLNRDSDSLAGLKQARVLLVRKHGADAEASRNILVKIQEVANRLGSADEVRQAETSLSRLDRIKDWEVNMPKLTADMTEEQATEVERKLEAASTSASEFGEVSRPRFLVALNRLLLYRSRKMVPQEYEASNQLVDVAIKYFGEKHPEVAAVYFLRAECQNRREQLASAIDDYKKSILVNEESGFMEVETQLRSLLRLAQTYSSQKLHADAIPVFEKYIGQRKSSGVQDDAEFGSVKNQYGVCQTAIGDFEKAMVSYQESYALLTRFVPAEAPILKTVESNFEFAKGELNKIRASQKAAAETKTTPTTRAVGAEGMQGVASNRGVNEGKLDRPKAEETPSKWPPFYMMVITFVLACYVATRARQKGYRRLRWFWAFLCSCTSPVLVPCVLAMLPDRSIDQRRKKLFESLDKELASTPGAVKDSSKLIEAGVLSESIGDQVTHR